MRYITDPNEKSFFQGVLRLAAQIAFMSVCKKAKRGVILLRGREIIGKGWNNQTRPSQCDNCPRENVHDGSQHDLCLEIHAEQMAILDALKNGYSNLRGTVMIQIKVKGGQMVPSEKPTCTWCSRYLEYFGINFVLWHREGIAIYAPDEINTLSLQNRLS